MHLSWCVYDLDEQQRNGQGRIHITMCIVEEHACQLRCRDIEGTIPDPAGAVGVDLHPGDEDAGVKLSCDEDQTLEVRIAL